MVNALAVIVAVTLSTQASTPVPAANCDKVEGDFIAHVVPPPTCPADSLCTAGDLSGGLKGTYEFHIVKPPTHAGEPALASVQFFVGQSTVTLRKGGTLTGTDTGTIDMPPGGQGGFASLITWTGGATGQIRLMGVFDPARQTTTGEYEGTVCRPR